MIDEIEEMTEAGRPVLVGTVSVEKSEILGELLRRRGIKHEVLNAKFHEKEAGIVAQAGRTGAVTIATNMAGRGTDIVLGGNPAGLASEMLHQRGLNPAEVDKATYDEVFREAKARCDAEHDVVVAAGGLHIVGTERHESRRIDNQLRGRAGRQGDPGSSRFYLSLEDDLMKRFASDRVAGLMERLGLEDDVAIESRLVSKTIESAQSRVEGFNFDIRKRVVEFDDVINKQRETIYAERDKVLHNEDLTDTVRAFLDEELEALLDQHCAGEHPDDWGMEALSMALRAMGLDGPGTSEDELWEVGGREALAGAPPRAGRRAARGEGGRGRRGRLGDGGAARAAPHDRLALGGAPHRARRHAARDRPSRLCPAGPAQRVQEGGVQPLRPAAGADPAPGGDHHLPGPGREAAGRPDARRGAARGQPRGGRHGDRGERRVARPRAAAAPEARARPRAAARRRRPRAAASWPGGSRPGRRSGPCSSRSATAPRRPRRRPGRARSWAATIPATAARGSSTRSATGAERRRPPLGRSDAGRGRPGRARGRLAVTAYATFRIWQRGDVDDAPRMGTADAIVVLGAAQYDGRPSPVFQARLDHAIALWREGRAPLLVMTGGRPEGDRSTEAATARDYAIGQGVPAASIRMEDGGRSTLESLRGRRRRSSSGRPSSRPSSSRTGATCCACCGWRATSGSRRTGRRPTDSPMDATMARRVEATLHELGALAWYGLVGQPVPETEASGS